MLFGPVFHAELVTTSRRARYYAIRFVYGLILLFQIYATYQANAWRSDQSGRGMLIGQMAEFGQSLFYSFASVQMFAVLVLTPALVGGTIAEERQRKTLHYLLASSLTGFEIVVGKLAARILHVAVLLALGLPVVALVGLFGGVDFGLLAACYAGTLSTVYFLAALSILISSGSRRPREAIVLIYVLEALWLFGPMTLMSWLPGLEPPWPMVAAWINPVLRWVGAASPFSLAWSLVIRGGRLGSPTAAVEMIACQVGYGTILVLIAAFRLRPAFRSEAGSRPGPRWLERLGARRRWWGRPPIGDHAMFWKERHVSRSTGATRVVMNLLAVVVLGFVGYWTFHYFIGAVDEAGRLGMAGGGTGRRDFGMYLRVVTVILYVLWMLGVATASAGSITSEREGDTWISLTASTLEGREILGAKLLGPIWSLRAIAYLLGLLWMLGLAVGSISPLGVLACTVEFAVFSWFLVALGTAFSFHSRSTTRALAATMATLIFTNGGYLFCCLPLGRGNDASVFAGVTPALLALSLTDYREFSGPRPSGANPIAAVLIGLCFYGVASQGLTSYLYHAFDDLVGRPNRLDQVRPPASSRIKPPKPPGEVDLA